MTKKYETAAKLAAAIIAALPGVLTYTELAERTGTNKRMLGGPLDLVALLCLKLKVPHLTVMVVTAGTKDDIVPMPGAAAFDPKTDKLLTLNIPRYEIGAWQAKVREFDWAPHLATLSDPAAYGKLEQAAAEPVVAITRRVPEAMVPLLDKIIAALKEMSPEKREEHVAALVP